jgi:large repetitive protein
MLGAFVFNPCRVNYNNKTLILVGLFGLLNGSNSFSQNPVSFTSSELSGVTIVRPTSLQFGPDNRLYMSQQDGTIYAYTIQKNGCDDYTVIATETILLIKNIPNHNDNGALNTSVNERQVTGILVKGTAVNPVLYVSSSDPRMWGGITAGDSELDTNSGMISKLTWNGTAWIKVDLVVGLPRSEENHSTNGLYLDETNNILYVAQGGNTNAGSPSNNFAFLCEYALSAAILAIDLNMIESQFGGTYLLPTLDDPTRPNTGPNGSDENDPFGGNDGLNQAKLVVGGPVQIYSPGYRNPYDLLITEAPGKEGRMYTIDNGANVGWGGHPDQEGAFGDPLTTNVTNNYVVGEPGSDSPGPNDDAVNNLDGLHLVSKPGMTPIYAGHPNPIRANPAGAGLYWYNNDTNTAHFELHPTVDWPPVPFVLANPVEGDFRNPGVDDGALYTWTNSTNGLAEYTSDKFFNGAMVGDLLTVSWDNGLYRIKLTPDGTAVDFVEELAYGFGRIPLDVIAQGNGKVFEGTIWVVSYFDNTIIIFEPECDDQIVGLPEMVSDRVTVYPNPGQSRVKLELPILSVNSSIHITDTQGRSVFSSSVVNKREIDLDIEALDKGVYFIHIRSEQLIKTVKLIVN